MPIIHSTAIVDREVELAQDVKIGAYAIIRGRVQIGSGTVVHEQTHIQGQTRIGRNCVLGPAAFLGMAPQHLKYTGEPTWLIVGDQTVVRETAIIHRATEPGEDHATRLGQHCYIMGQTHVAHDCVLGNEVIMCNGALLAGHCQIGDRAVLGGACCLHQFVRVGRLAIISGNEGSSRDVPPFAAVRYHGLKGYNAVGCRRAGFTLQAIHAIRAAYHCLHHHRNLATALAAIRDTVEPLPEVLELVSFIQSSKRGIHPSVHFRQPMDDAEG